MLVKNGRTGVEVLTTGLSGDQLTLPVFSFREEAEMFLCLRSSQGGWQVRETAAGELLSMFYTVLGGIRYVTLDPIPENSCLGASGLLSITRKDFMGRLEMANGRGRCVEKMYSMPPDLDRLQPTQSLG